MPDERATKRRCVEPEASVKGHKDNRSDYTSQNPLPLPDKHIIFQQWAKFQGVEMHSAVAPAALPGRGIGLQTRAPVRKGTRVLHIPEKAIFKPRKEDGKSLHKNGAGPSPHAHLALSAFRSFTKDLQLQKWSTTWPTEAELRDSLPLFWPGTLRDKLPLSTRAVLDRQRDDFEEDLRSTGQAGCSQFEYYWAIVNSRSFHWKPPGSKPGYMVLCPFIDYLNHGPNGTGIDVRQTSKGFEVHTDRDYGANEELLLTYGAHPNDKLLVHYGFIPSTPTEDSPSDDSIRLDHIILPKLSPRVASALQDTGYLGNYALIPSDGTVCFKTQVAIRAILFSANEWEYFSLNGEDMGVDRSDEVVKWLEPLLIEYKKEARRKIAELEQCDEQEVAVGLLRERWRQIAEGLAAGVK